MSARWRSTSPGVSSIHGTEPISGSLTERSPSLGADQPVTDVRVTVPSGAALEDRVVGVDEGEPRGEPSSMQLLGEGGDPGGLVDRHAGGEQMRGVEHEPEAIVGDLRAQLLGFAGERCHRAPRPRHQLGQHTDTLGLVHRDPEALRGGSQGGSAVLGTAGARVHHQQVHAERVARVDGLDEQLTRPPERRRIPRRDVPHVGEMGSTRSEARVGEREAEPIDLRFVVSGTGPGPRVRDEDL